MSRDEIIAANPLETFLTNRGFDLRRSGENRVTNGCPVTVHRKYHRPVTIDVEKQLWHCNDCKVGGTVIEWIARERGCDAAEAKRILGGGSNGAEERPKPIKTYNYTDEKGQLLFQTCRYEPKDFRQRRPDGKGGWIWNLRGVERVLYNLPAVIKADTVAIAEGEKDCDNLGGLGFTATCNPYGAGKWRDEYSETLGGKDVILFWDRGDDKREGETHAEQVIASLTGKARSIKRVTLPDGFHDVSDYIASLPSETAARTIAKLIEEQIRGGLVVRSAREIVDLELDENDCLLGDRLLTKSGKLVIAGPGGIGKSRKLLQLAAASITGCDWCGIETHARGLRWLILQTENSNRRLQFDLRSLKNKFGEGFLDNLFIRTLEGEELLSLHTSGAAIESIIEEIRPDIIAWDPVRDFVIGDPNSDRDMTETLLTIGRICRKGDANRAIGLVHHALTGKAGAAKSVGWERSGYARNSKVLMSWARAQINVAPAKPDENDVLVLACGKNNDGKEFPSFAVRLNPNTMIYELNPEFDVEGWREELSTMSGKSGAQPQMLRDLLVKDREYDKARIVELIREETGVGKSRAYKVVDQAKTRRILRYNKTIKTYELW